MEGKQVIDAEEMAGKVRAMAAVRDRGRLGTGDQRAHRAGGLSRRPIRKIIKSQGEFG
jgi:hypothetical protein